MDAGDLLAAFAARELSPVEALEACEARVDPGLGAFQATVPGTGRGRRREAAEAAWARGEPTGAAVRRPDRRQGPDRHRGRGDRVRLARCSPATSRTPTPSAWRACARPARSSSARPPRTSSRGACRCGAPTARPLTRNPRDPERATGGSSGGSAVAVAAGAAPLALGTDTGGSIRLPAGWCGIYGFKPTHGVLSVEGVWPLAPSLDHVGPMARSAARLRARCSRCSAGRGSTADDAPRAARGRLRGAARRRGRAPRSTAS